MELSPLTAEDMVVVAEWLKDKELLRATMVEPPDITRPMITLLIRLKTGEPVGWVDIFNVDLQNSKAELGIAIPDERGRGLSFRAGKEAIDLAFGKLGLRRVEARVAASNYLPRRLCSMLGFAKEGWEKDACYKEGQWEDIIVYGLVNPNWKDERQVK